MSSLTIHRYALLFFYIDTYLRLNSINMISKNSNKHSRGGRPTLPDSERRIVRVQPAFTAAEMETLEQRAAAFGINLCTWVRMASLGLSIKSVPAINRTAYSELSKLASNLNQLAHVANSTSAISASDLVKMLCETKDKVQELRCLLLGTRHDR